MLNTVSIGYSLKMGMGRSNSPSLSSKLHPVCHEEIVLSSELNNCSCLSFICKDYMAFCLLYLLITISKVFQKKITYLFDMSPQIETKSLAKQVKKPEGKQIMLTCLTWLLPDLYNLFQHF